MPGPHLNLAQSKMMVTDYRTCRARADETYRGCTTDCARPLRERNICLVWCKRYRDGQIAACRSMYR